jgi:hypothetical protein
MAHLTFRVSDQLASRFEAAAATRGGKSRLLRSLVEGVTGALPAGDGAGEGAPRGVSDKVTVRLRSEELERLDEASRAAGMRRTEWVAACLRRRLLGRPQFNREQAEALLEARGELRRISVQLRELVRAVREGDLPVAALEPRLTEVEEFRTSVRSQLDGVRRALDGEAAYWGAEE